MNFSKVNGEINIFMYSICKKIDKSDFLQKYENFKVLKFKKFSTEKQTKLVNKLILKINKINSKCQKTSISKMFRLEILKRRYSIRLMRFYRGSSPETHLYLEAYYKTCEEKRKNVLFTQNEIDFDTLKSHPFSNIKIMDTLLDRVSKIESGEDENETA